MKPFRTVVAVMVVVGLGLWGAVAGGGSAAADAPGFPGTYAFVDVHVVPMDALHVLEHQTVLVRDGVIREVGDTGSVEIPSNATRIEGDGRYLLPGLGDMHVQLPGSEASAEEVEELLFLYVANGVTTIRQASSRRGHRTLKSRLLRDEILGPTLYVASPPLSLDRTRSAPDSVASDSLRAEVERLARERWDLLRVPEEMSLREWEWMTDAVTGFGLAYGGPVPDSVGLAHALATGISTVDRLDGLLDAVVDDRHAARIREIYAPSDAGGASRGGAGDGDGSPARADPGSDVGPQDTDTPVSADRHDPRPPVDSLVRAVERRKVWAVAGRARAAGAWTVPTLFAQEVRYRPDAAETLLTLPELRYVSPGLRASWEREVRDGPRYDSTTVRGLLQTRMEAARAWNDLNAGLVLGTASPGPFIVPGFSVHREMRRLEASGIAPYEVLLAATRSVARYASGELRQSGRFGTVAAGNRADLVLVEENPLDDLRTLERRAGVMVRGRWLPSEEIDRRLEEIAQRYR